MRYILSVREVNEMNSEIESWSWCLIGIIQNVFFCRRGLEYIIYNPEMGVLGVT